MAGRLPKNLPKPAPKSRFPAANRRRWTRRRRAIQAAGGEAVGIAAHSGDKAALHALVDQTLERYGKLDILVNNAAANPHFGAVLDAEDSYWRKTIEVNLMGNLWLSQAAVKVMRAHGGGKIINVASIVGLNPGQFQGIYSITKAAVISLTKTLALELGGDNIQVNAIAPGLIKTKFSQALWENEALMQQIIARMPAGRIGQPMDIAGLAVFLASAASDFTTGAVLVADGGLTVGANLILASIQAVSPSAARGTAEKLKIAGQP